jgi:hypothetical protein
VTTDLERRLHDELAGLAATTRTAPDALDRIVRGAERSRRRSRVPLVVAAALAVALLVAAVVVRAGEQAQPVVTQLPPEPPAVTGTVQAEVDTIPCAGDCLDGAFRFPAADPGAVDAAPTLGEPVLQHAEFLADGRYFRSDGDRVVFADPATGAAVDLDLDWVYSAEVLADGHVAVVGGREDGPQGLADLDPDSGELTWRPVPSGFYPSAVAVGPDGSIALLGGGEGDCCLSQPELVVVAPDGSTSSHELDDALGGRRPFVDAEPEISWGPSGLVAVSTDSPMPFVENSPLEGWTVVVDPANGELVAALDGWQGLAWSPDGRGLMAAGRAGRRSSDVAVFWGPDLSSRIDVGRAPLPVVPRYWLP